MPIRCIFLTALCLAITGCAQPLFQRNEVSFRRGPYNFAFYDRHNEAYRFSTAIHVAHGKAHDVLELTPLAEAERWDRAFDGEMLHVAYARGGLPRFRQESVASYLDDVEELRGAGMRVGVAPHSVRACPADWLVEIARYATREGLPLHAHADEQPREIEECLAEHGCRPIELLERTGCLGRRTTVVHATHADGRELDLLAASGATICACPTTEADLGDGFLPATRIRHRGIRLCIGSDSNVRIDPLEELRELEGIARRQSGRRGVFPTDALFEMGGAAGARSLGLDAWPGIEIDLAHPSLAGVAAEHVEAALVSGCCADVIAA